MTASTDTYVLRPSCPNPVPSEIRLSEGGRKSLLLVILPGTSCGINLDIHLEGKGAEAEIAGLFLCREDERVDIDINLYHDVPGCSSRQSFKGIVAGKARASFCGKVCVKPDAQKTEAYQENNNLLLSDDARVTSSPQLEIYADDVECSHGATTGFLNLDEQFYMRSRGIPESEARVLQIISFLAPILSAIPDENLRETLSARVEEAVRSL